MFGISVSTSLVPTSLGQNWHKRGARSAEEGTSALSPFTSVKPVHTDRAH